MLTFQEAKQIAKAKINTLKFTDDDTLIIIDEEIIEKEYAWIFPYTSKKLWETKDINYAIGGNALIFISKFDRQISSYRTGLSIDGMIDEHEEKNKLWTLTIPEGAPLDTGKFADIKKIFNWTLEQLIEFKKSEDKILERGSKRRLSEFQSLLTLNSIPTSLTLTK